MVRGDTGPKGDDGFREGIYRFYYPEISVERVPEGDEEAGNLILNPTQELYVSNTWTNFPPPPSYHSLQSFSISAIYDAIVTIGAAASSFYVTDSGAIGPDDPPAHDTGNDFIGPARYPQNLFLAINRYHDAFTYETIGVMRFIITDPLDPQKVVFKLQRVRFDPLRIRYPIIDNENRGLLTEEYVGPLDVPDVPGVYRLAALYQINAPTPTIGTLFLTEVSSIDIALGDNIGISILSPFISRDDFTGSVTFGFTFQEDFNGDGAPTPMTVNPLPIYSLTPAGPVFSENVEPIRTIAAIRSAALTVFSREFLLL